MVLIVCGDVNDDTVLSIVNKKLENSYSQGSVPVKINENDFESPCASKPYVEQRMQVSKPLFSIGFKDTAIPKDPWERQKKDAIMAILDEMLFSRAGELYNLLIDKNMISPNFSYGYTISEYAAYNSLSGECDDPQTVFDTIMKYLKSIDKSMLDRNKFEIGRRVMYAEFVKSFDSTDSIANNLLSFACEDSELLSYADIISSISFDDVVDAFENSFNENTAVLSVVLPI